MKARKVCIVGGTGFVGHHLIARLQREDYAIRVLTRYRERHRDLLVFPNVEVRQAHIYNERELEHHFAECDAVINLVGILNERHDNGKGFHRAHVELTQKIVEACHSTEIRRLLHMSALHADAAQGPSYYLRTKGEAESILHAAKNLDSTIFRPSVIFGPGDSFLNRFADLLRKAPILPLACANSRFAPVYVNDVITAFTKALDNPHTHGQRYDLCGPKIYTLQELVEYTASLIDVQRPIIGLGKTASYLQAMLLEHAPGKPLSRDNFRSLQQDSVCDGEFPAIFGIQPTALEQIAPQYLAQRYQRARYGAFRRRARR